jgi:hexosaminidase
MPNNVEAGNTTYTLSKQCRFNFLTDEKSDEMKMILSIYHKIINSDNYDNDDILYRSFLNNCIYNITINVKFDEMKNYTLNYLPIYESYLIDITTDLNVRIESTYLNGLLRALETLSQVLYLNMDKQRIEVYNLPLRIEDYPRFPYRGVMIDTSRQYISLNKIKEIIRGMLYGKLNVLHWHITDDEYFSFKTSVGIVTGKNAYTKDQIAEIIDYAYFRGITVIPEIDNPSHTRSWILDSSKFNETITISKQEYGNLNPALDLTYDIVDKLIKELIQTFTNGEKDQLIHIGGDEVLSSYWEREDIRKFMKEHNIDTIKQLENYYFNRVGTKLPDNTNYIYWVDNNSEIYDVYNKSNSILMYWGISGKLNEFLDKFSNNTDRNIILTPGEVLYLDCGSGNKYGDETWCGNYHTWKDIYKISLIDNHNSFRVLGYQATLFGELADENSISGKIFPRALSLAERLWTKSDSIDIKSAFMRLMVHNRRLMDRGIKSISISSQFCEAHPLECIDNIK